MFDSRFINNLYINKYSTIYVFVQIKTPFYKVHESVYR